MAEVVEAAFETHFSNAQLLFGQQRRGVNQTILVDELRKSLVGNFLEITTKRRYGHMRDRGDRFKRDGFLEMVFDEIEYVVDSLVVLDFGLEREPAGVEHLVVIGCAQLVQDAEHGQQSIELRLFLQRFDFWAKQLLRVLAERHSRARAFEQFAYGGRLGHTHKICPKKIWLELEHGLACVAGLFVGESAVRQIASYEDQIAFSIIRHMTPDEPLARTAVDIYQLDFRMIMPNVRLAVLVLLEVRQVERTSETRRNALKRRYRFHDGFG